MAEKQVDFHQQKLEFNQEMERNVKKLKLKNAHNQQITKHSLSQIAKKQLEFFKHHTTQQTQYSSFNISGNVGYWLSRMSCLANTI